MHLHAVYSSLLFFQCILGWAKEGEEWPSLLGKMQLISFKHMNGSENIQANTTQYGSGQYNMKVLSEYKRV